MSVLSDVCAVTASRDCAAPAVARRARWIDIGTVEPAFLHAAYAGIAAAQDRDDEPVVLWARSQPHVSIGQSQDRQSEIVADPGVPVVRRTLGGGAVWIDEDQCCFALVIPAGSFAGSRGQLMACAVATVTATLRHFGLAASPNGHDVWVCGRKIAGSGAASIGTSSVVASSFMFRFPAERFAHTIALPSAGLAAWLREGLALTVTDWDAHARRPCIGRLAREHRRCVGSVFGWRIDDDSLRSDELRAIEAHCGADDDWVVPAGRTTNGGIRLNARSYLTEVMEETGRRRTLVVDGRIVRTTVDACAHH